MNIVRQYGATIDKGTGADGALVFDGVNPVTGHSLSGGVYTQTRAIQSSSEHILAGVEVRSANWSRKCTGTVTNDNGGHLHNDGKAGTVGHCGALTNAGDNTTNPGGAGDLLGSAPGSASSSECTAGISESRDGQPGSVRSGTSVRPGGDGGDGGIGGATTGTLPVPGAAGSGINGGGGGGGKGGNTWSGDGGNGGGQAGSGGPLDIACAKLVNNGRITSNGGKGGDATPGANAFDVFGGGGGGAGAGGGGGGSAGDPRISFDEMSGTGTIEAISGTFGAASTGGLGTGGNGDGQPGFPGTAGSDGVVYLITSALPPPLSPVTATFSLGSIAGATNDDQALLLMPAFNAGDRRAQKRFGDLFIEAQVPVGSLIQVALWSAQYSSIVPSYSPSTLTPANGGLRAPYVIDFASGDGFYGVDLEAAISWELGTDASLVTWQPTVIPQPESVQNRPTDWDAAGTDGAKFVQGLIVEADTFGLPKMFTVQSSDDLSFHSPTEVPVTFTGQSIIPFSFATPFIAHSMRIHSTDDVPWRIYGVRWVTKPFPESMVQWITEGISHGLLGWQHIFMLNIAHISTVDLRVEMTFDGSRTLDVVVPNSGGVFQKTKVPVGVNKFKTVSYKVTCDSSGTAPFRLFFKDLEIWCKQWGSVGPYSNVKPFGGDSSEGAEV